MNENEMNFFFFFWFPFGFPFVPPPHSFRFFVVVRFSSVWMSQSIHFFLPSPNFSTPKHIHPHILTIIIIIIFSEILDGQINIKKMEKNETKYNECLNSSLSLSLSLRYSQNIISVCVLLRLFMSIYFS